MSEETDVNTPVDGNVKEFGLRFAGGFFFWMACRD